MCENANIKNIVEDGISPCNSPITGVAPFNLPSSVNPFLSHDAQMSLVNNFPSLSEAEFWKGEMMRERSALDSMMQSIKVYQAQTHTLTAKVVALEEINAQLMRKVEAAKRKEENVRTHNDEELAEGDEVFLGCHDRTETQFVKRLQDHIALLCYKKGQKMNWNAAALEYKVAQLTSLKRPRKNNGRNDFVKYKGFLRNTKGLGGGFSDSGKSTV
jgi:hypothetical protein